jgi:hypothetical protein
VPFAEASWAADFILNQQNLLRMHNRLVKQERSLVLGRMTSPHRAIVELKSRFKSTGLRLPRKGVTIESTLARKRQKTLGAMSGCGQSFTIYCAWQKPKSLLEHEMAVTRLVVAFGPGPRNL